MRIVVVALSLLVSPSSCLLRVSVPATAATPPTHHHAAQATAAVSAIPAARHSRGGGRGAVGQSRERALIGKVHGVARGGGGEEGEGILGYAASLPLLQVLPPQVSAAVVIIVQTTAVVCMMQHVFNKEKAARCYCLSVYMCTCMCMSV